MVHVPYRLYAHDSESSRTYVNTRKLTKKSAEFLLCVLPHILGLGAGGTRTRSPHEERPCR